jgi:hypothetical protein
MISSLQTSRFFTRSLNVTVTAIVTRYSCACAAVENPNTAFLYCVTLPRTTQLADFSSTTRRWLSRTKRSTIDLVMSCSSVYSVVPFSNTGIATDLRCVGSSAGLVV